MIVLGPCAHCQHAHERHVADAEGMCLDCDCMGWVRPPGRILPPADPRLAIACHADLVEALANLLHDTAHGTFAHGPSAARRAEQALARARGETP